MKERDSLHRLLRSLPPQRAPASLETRVLRTLERREHAPWWRLNFRHWPLPACVVFVLACAASVALVWWSGAAGSQEILAVGGRGAVILAWLRSLAAALTSIDRAWGAVTQAVPALWVYGALALGASLYTVLFIVGAAAYRALYRPSGVGMTP